MNYNVLFNVYLTNGVGQPYKGLFIWCLNLGHSTWLAVNFPVSNDQRHEHNSLKFDPQSSAGGAAHHRSRRRHRVYPGLYSGEWTSEITILKSD